MQSLRGCGVPGMTATLLGKEKVTTCPRYFIKQNPRTFWRIAELHQFLEKGYLPDDGGMNDQSALTMEALRLFSLGLSEGNKVLRSKTKTR